MGGLGPLAKVKDQVPFPLIETCKGCNFYKTKAPEPSPVIAPLIEFLETIAGRNSLGITTAVESFTWAQEAALEGKLRARSLSLRRMDARQRKRAARERMQNAANALTNKR